MEIVVKRKWTKYNYTIGQMYVNGSLYCHTLEDTDRGLLQSMELSVIKSIKVYGETAIPKGRYRVGVTYWSKHKVNVPILYNVPGYTDILIHNGATRRDTLGCILVGENNQPGRLTNGKKYMVELTKMVNGCRQRGEEVWITIE